MNILTIGGSDPSSGAGIQSDVKTFSQLGAYGLTIVTAITSQNTQKFSKVEPVSPTMIKNQIDSIFSDFVIDAIKISMVYNSPTINAIHQKLRKLQIPVILDPVIKSTTEGDLLLKNALTDYRRLLMPLAEITTPNLSEAQTLTGLKIKNKKDLEKAAIKLKEFGAKNVVITGLTFEKGKIFDFVFDDSAHFLVGKKLSIKNHGSGCNFSAALAVQIAKKNNILDSVKFAKNFARNSIKNSEKVGKGIRITNFKEDPIKKDLETAILHLQKIKNIYKAIPECQTNFVFSKNNPKSLKNILGISGRIVRAEKSTVVAGELKYGGSKHVASAVLETNKKFPQIRSAINIRFDQKFLKKFEEKKFRITSYNRGQEPITIKNKENSSVSWGVKTSIKNLQDAPDIIYHKGDLGKEAMILVFGKEPKEILRKLAGIF